MDEFKKGGLYDGAGSEWEERKHPRDSDGKFSNSGSNNSLKQSTVKIDLDSDIQKQFEKATPHEKQKLAFDYIMDNLRGRYPSEDGRTIAIERVGADKITHTKNETKIKVTPALADLIQSCKFKKIVDAEHKLFDKFAYYDVEFEIADEKYEGVLNVGIRKNGESSLYDLNPFNKK